MTRALILAAGQGSRLRPVTNDIPKCLVPLYGRPLLEMQAATLRDCGVDPIAVVGGYRADAIAARGFDVVHNSAFETTNMVASLFAARDRIKAGEDLLIGYGDIVYQRNNLQQVLDVDGDITLMIDRQWRDLWSLRLDDPLSDAETLRVTADGRVTELGKVPESYAQVEGQYTGLIKVSGARVNDLLRFHGGLDRAARYDGQSFDNMYMTSFIQAMIDADWAVQAAFVDRGWLEIDTTEDLRTYTQMSEDGTLQAFFDPQR